MSENLPNTINLLPEEQALLLNDLSKLSSDQRSSLYIKVCQSIGLNHLTQPFSYILLNGKLTLYAQRNCTDQLRSIRNVSVVIQSRTKIDDLYVVCARAKLPNGREDESIGSVSISGLRGDALANAMMKAETKAKRRVTLSICGLSFLDETEVETIKDAKPIIDEPPKQIEHSESTSATPPPVQASDSSTTEETKTNEFVRDAKTDSKPQVNVKEYVIKIGINAGKKMIDVDKSKISLLVNWLNNNRETFSADEQEFLLHAYKYIDGEF